MKTQKSEKPIYEKVSFTKSIIVKREKFSFFDIPWHFHPEFELALIVKGKGRKFVGSFFDQFIEGDLTLYGSNIPHSWKSDGSITKGVEQIIIHFSQELFEGHLFSKEEFRPIKELLKKSAFGIGFDEKVRQEVIVQIKAMLKMDDFQKIIRLLEILNLLARGKSYKVLNSGGARDIYSNENDGARMNKIFSYIFDNFKNDISLKEISSIANLTPVSFSRYFKSRTRKTFSLFLNEVKIQYACRLLTQDAMSVSQVSHECGFSNVSNFNRQFKKLTRCSPSGYIKRSYHK